MLFKTRLKKKRKGPPHTGKRPDPQTPLKRTFALSGTCLRTDNKVVDCGTASAADYDHFVVISSRGACAEVGVKPVDEVSGVVIERVI